MKLTPALRWIRKYFTGKILLLFDCVSPGNCKNNFVATRRVSDLCQARSLIVEIAFQERLYKDRENPIVVRVVAPSLTCALMRSKLARRDLCHVRLSQVPGSSTAVERDVTKETLKTSPLQVQSTEVWRSPSPTKSLIRDIGGKYKEAMDKVQNADDTGKDNSPGKTGNRVETRRILVSLKNRGENTVDLKGHLAKNELTAAATASHSRNVLTFSHECVAQVAGNIFRTMGSK
ncbi:hypothetical protein RRG08_056175 [Elysia crispata]|uniref:Uncharacterized protein n=1 Tax=Elysia crispata TaxID=231223 RepID=A0AAE0Z0U6_9GAST|nr:hypothetical protein RRG08_056175 [Elysia crispata]